MKKLMIIAALAMAAVSVNAAQLKWQLVGTYSNKINDGDKVWTKVTGSTDHTAYFILASNESTIETALKAGTFAGENTLDSFSTFNNYGGIANDKAKVANNAAIKVTPAQAYELLLTYKDSEGVVHYQFTDSLNAEGTADYETTPANIAFNYENLSASGWQTVPEPTSGLLLLLGVAGLALRRRRA